MPLISDKDLDLWIKNNCNVLLIGKHGLGKSSVIIDAFKRHNLKYQYYSASTMDPWADFVGIPKQVTNADGTSYLTYIRPEVIERGEVEALMFDEFNRCVSGDTKILLVDGKSVPIKDLVGVETFYVYSYDSVSKAIVVGRGHSARKTKRNQKLLKVTVDNGAYIRCTYDHPFLLSNGTYKKAENLVPNDSLMPLYRIWESHNVGLTGYELVWQPKKNSKWVFTYHMADDFNLKYNVYTKESGNHRHHLDFDKNNNSPENILRLSMVEHLSVHGNSFLTSSLGGMTAHKKHKDLCDKSILSPEGMKLAHKNSIKTRRTSKSYKELRSKISKDIYTPEMREYRKGITKNQWKSGQFDNIDRISALKKNHTIRTFNVLIKENISGETLSRDSYSALREDLRKKGYYLLKLPKIEEWFGTFSYFVEKYSEYVVFKTTNNHRVVSVLADGREDVYDITVDDYHNFAVEAGVFVHNSSKKVRNAVMELIQFKSINGKVLPNLKIVWAAINPYGDDETFKYDVDELDEAQKDRFHVIYTLPQDVDADYFLEKYKDKAYVDAAVEWWKGLPPDQKDLCSPRRLDYALELHRKGINLRHVLDKALPIRVLVKKLATGPIKDTIPKIFEELKTNPSYLIDHEDLVLEIKQSIMNNEYSCASLALSLSREQFKSMLEATYNERLPLISYVTKHLKDFVSKYGNDVFSDYSTLRSKVRKLHLTSSAPGNAPGNASPTASTLPLPGNGSFMPRHIRALIDTPEPLSITSVDVTSGKNVYRNMFSLTHYDKRAIRDMASLVQDPSTKVTTLPNVKALLAYILTKSQGTTIISYGSDVKTIRKSLYNTRLSLTASNPPGSIDSDFLAIDKKLLVEGTDNKISGIEDFSLVGPIDGSTLDWKASVAAIAQLTREQRKRYIEILVKGKNIV